MFWPVENLDWPSVEKMRKYLGPLLKMVRNVGMVSSFVEEYNYIRDYGIPETKICFYIKNTFAIFS